MLTHFKNSSFMPVQRLTILITSLPKFSSYANITFWCKRDRIQHILFAEYVRHQVLNFLKKRILIEIPELNYVVFWDAENNNLFNFMTKKLILQR